MKAGRVFAPTSDSRVVYAEIEGVEENMALVEGDEEDFEGLLVWIRRNGGFEVGGDGLERRGVCGGCLGGWVVRGDRLGTSGRPRNGLCMLLWD